MSRTAAAAATCCALLLTALPGPALARDPDRVIERVDRAREVYEQLVRSPDRAVPQALLERARAIAIFPGVIKGALGFGARYGKGVVAFRDESGEWSPLAFFTLTGGSWGLQLGAESADIVLIFTTDRGARSLLESKFTLGGKMGVAAGPIGRTAEAGTDVKLQAEIYSYARSRGLFAGVSLEGARLAPDEASNAAFYGEPVGAKAILIERRVPAGPEAGARLRKALP